VPLFERPPDKAPPSKLRKGALNIIVGCSGNAPPISPVFWIPGCIRFQPPLPGAIRPYQKWVLQIHFLVIKAPYTNHYILLYPLDIYTREKRAPADIVEHASDLNNKIISLTTPQVLLGYCSPKIFRNPD